MLHALVEYARQQGLESDPGFRPKAIRYLLQFSKKGQYLGIVPLGDKKGQIFPSCPDLSQPELKAGGSGCRHFLVDGLDVLALLTKDGKPADGKQRAKHAYFIGLLDDAAAVLPELKAIAAKVRDPATVAQIKAELGQLGRKASPTDLATIGMIDPLRIFVEEESWHDWWRDFRRRLADKRRAKRTKRGGGASEDGSGQMLCLLSGELVEPALTHPKITGLADVGGFSAGDVFASFKQEAFCSYGLNQAQNAAMSEEMAEVYRSTLNCLIARSQRLVGSRIVYWYVGREVVRPEEDPITAVVNGLFPELEVVADSEPSARDKEREAGQALDSARSLVESIRSSERAALLDYEFRAMTLAGNSGRAIVRGWMEGRFEDLARNIDAWFADLSVIARDGLRLARSPKFYAVLGGLVRALKDVPPPLELQMWRSAVTWAALPPQAAHMALSRFTSDLIKDEVPNHAQVGVLKMFCIRNGRFPMTAALDNDLDDSAYVCGRILALLAAIQQRAMPNVGAGVVQRYYSAASSTPGLVLGRLVRLAQTGHLPQIEPPGLREWLDQRLADLWSRLKTAPPATLSLSQQTLFAMGFYHQKAARMKTDEK